MGAHEVLRLHKKFAQAAKTFIYSSTKGATEIDRESEEDSEQWNFYFTEEYKGNEGVRHGIEVGFNIWSDFDTGFVRENAKASIWRCFGEASIFAHQAPTDRLEDSH